MSYSLPTREEHFANLRKEADHLWRLMPPEDQKALENRPANIRCISEEELEDSGLSLCE